MKQDISALMDGELFDDEAEALFDGIKQNPQAQSDWAMYHMVGDALRQPGHFHTGISTALHERLKAEPTVLAPRSRPRQNMKWFAFSAAASLMGVSLVGWMAMQIGQDSTPRMAMQQQAAAVRPASFQANKPAVNDYLMAHQEFSPGTDEQGAVAYIRTVSERQ